MTALAPHRKDRHVTYDADPLMRSVAGVTGEVEAAIAEIRRLEQGLEEAQELLREAHAEIASQKAVINHQATIIAIATGDERSRT